MEFETAIKLIPLYGDGKHDDLQAYIEAVSFVIENCEVDDKKKYLSIAKLRIRGEVGAAVRRNDLSSWNELKKFLRERGDKLQSESYLEDQLIYIKQGPKDSVREFADRIEKLGHKLIIAQAKSGIDTKAAELSAERRMHKSFTKGVNEPIKGILLNRKTFSFEDAVKDALSLELDLEEERVLAKPRKPFVNNNSLHSTSSGDKRCFICNKFGHVARDCRNKSVKTVSGKDRPNNACFNCGKPGHFARDCWFSKTQKYVSHKPRDSSQRGDQGETSQQGNGQNLSMNSRPERFTPQHKSGEYKAAGRDTFK